MSGWLDLLRGCAALAVVFGHIDSILYTSVGGKITWIASGLRYASGFSHQAVLLFFVLSGYLIGGPYIIKNVQGCADPGGYCAARLARMLTVVVPALALTAIADNITLSISGQSVFVASGLYPLWYSIPQQLHPSVAACNLAFMQMIACYQFGSNVSLWSLSNEMLYYFLFLSLALAVTTRKPFAAIVAVGIVAAMAFSSLPHDAGRSMRYFVYFIVWASGAGIFIFDKAVIRWGAIAAAFAAVIGFRILATKGNWLASDIFYSALFVLVVLTLEKIGRFPPIGAALWRFLANISFSLYAIHLPVLLLTTAVSPSLKHNTVIAFAAMTIVAVATASAFYLCFERHTKAIRTMFTRVMTHPRFAMFGLAPNAPPPDANRRPL